MLPQLVVGLALVWGFLRIFFAADILDEAWHLGMAYRFLLGDRPFVDDQTIYQTSSFLYYPMVWAYDAFFKSMNGIVLFSRICYFASASGAALIIYRQWRDHVDRRVLAVAVTSLFLYVHGEIPNFNYNSLGALFFTLGISTGVKASFERKARGFFWVGVLHTLAWVGHPGLTAALILFSVVVFLRVRFQQKGVAAGWYLGGLIIAPVTLLSFVPFANLANAFLFQSALGHAPGIDKLVGLSFFSLSPKKLVLCLAALGAIVFLKGRPRQIPYAAPFMVLAAWWLGMGSSGFLAYFMALGLLFYLLLARDFTTETLFWLAWVPSFLAYHSAASASGIHNGSAGFLPAVIVTMLFFAQLLHSRGTALQMVVSALPILLLAGSSTYDAFTLHPKSEVWISQGPFRGIRACRNDEDLLANLQKDLADEKNPRGKLLAYDHLPIAYLYTRRRPAGLSLYQCAPVSAGNLCVEHLEKHWEPGTMVLRHQYLNAADHPLTKAILPRVKQTSSNLHYTRFDSE